MRNSISTAAVSGSMPSGTGSTNRNATRTAVIQKRRSLDIFPCIVDVLESADVLLAEAVALDILPIYPMAP